MSVELKDKVVLITGAGRGIGAAVSRDCVKRGASVLLVDSGVDLRGDSPDPRVVGDVADSLRELGGEVESRARDITEPGACDELVALALQRFGRLDGVVCAAGVQRKSTIVRTRAEDLTRAFDVHVRSAFAITAAASEAMQKTGGSLVFMGSASAFFGVRRGGVEAATSAALVAFAKTTSLELRKWKVRANVVVPTARTRATIDSPLFQGIPEESMSPEHVAPVVSYLLSDTSSGVSGEVVGVAGGRVYALTHRETGGAFSDGPPFELDQIHARWRDITRD